MNQQIATTIRKVEAFIQDKDDALAIPRESAEFVYALLRATGARMGLEIGTSYGYSSLWAAAALAFVPTVVGCIRFTRNNVKDVIMPEFHMGLPRTVYALYIATLFTSHVFHNPWVYHPAGNTLLYSLGAVFILTTSFLVLTLRPYFAKPKRDGLGWVIFCTVFFLTTSIAGFIAGLILGDLRIFADALFVNFSLYTWFQHMSIPDYKLREAKRYVEQLIREWKEEMG